MEYTETGQNTETIQKIIDMLEVNEPVYPIVLIDNNLILDGHHRACAMEISGIEIPTISLTSAQYEVLKENGFDDLEIAAAVHIIADTGGEIAIEQQFPGSNVFERAHSAAEILDTL